MSSNYAYMVKEGEAIKRVPLNEWGRYRRGGWAFSSEKEWNAQQADATHARAEEKTKVSKKKKKVMRR